MASEFFMTSIRLLARLFAALSTLVLATGAASAQEKLIPIKLGLWEVTSKSATMDAARVMMQEQMKTMPPEQRAQMENRMGGLGAGPRKVCVTKDMIEKGLVGESQSKDCDATTTWKGRSSVTDFKCKSGQTGRTEFNYPNPETYSGVVDIKNAERTDRPDRSGKIELAGKWLSADCGDVVPRVTGMTRPPQKP